ncbi:MAG: N-6 DNA methylase [Pelovirga sp.]
MAPAKGCAACRKCSSSGPTARSSLRETHKDTLFIDAKDHYAQGTNQNKLCPEDIEHIVSTYRACKTVEKSAYRATLEEIRENDYNLNIPRYVDTFEEEAEIDLPAVQQEIDTLEAQLAAVRTEMRGHLKKLGLAPK